ncbi:hypothetical protein K2224_10070 [Streptomyces sp. BHT-5-2]|uniref:hypothetical protein n=1 Tax=unclassified Streptomyces TaxID=2593676 RepID=UPI001C8E3715|nr:hypothetical protein [Streptomyces sp. BHT-5-2]QZL03501.1 hypothetical protein K2224_10070 [Streptomyces sp. BHT-5-2]
MHDETGVGEMRVDIDDGSRRHSDAEGAQRVPDGRETARRPAPMVPYAGPSADRTTFESEFSRVGGYAQAVRAARADRHGGLAERPEIFG